MATKYVTLIALDGKTEVQIPETDRVELTNKLAAGFTRKGDRKAAAVRAEQKDAAK